MGTSLSQSRCQRRHSFWSEDGVRAHCGRLTVVSLLFGHVVRALHTQFGSSMWPQAKHNCIAKGSELIMSIMLAYLHTRWAARRKPPGSTHWATKVTLHSQERWHKSYEFYGCEDQLFWCQKLINLGCLLLQCLGQVCLAELVLGLSVA